MATPTTTTPPRRDGPSPPPLSTVAAAHYTRWGWPVTITGRRLLLIIGAPISVVELPADLAGQVQHHFAVRMLAGPVVALPGTPCRRLLLAGCADQAAQAGIDRLEHRGAITHRCGALVPLPPSRLARGAVTWTVSPALVEPWLPPFTAIAAAVRTLTHTAQPS